MNDFINRTDPKNINKLQLEGLVKSGAFDDLNENRNLIYSSIPNLIIKSKNIFENKSNNQIDLFSDGSVDSDEGYFMENINEWNFEEKLKIHIDKKIPPQSGLGGASSNAASVLLALNKIYNLR